MAKVLELKSDVIVVRMKNGETKEIRRAGMNFTPRIGEEVAVTEQDGRLSMSRYMDDGAHRVNQKVYAILAILVGGFGVHKFYARKIGLGVLYLLFVITGLPSLISIVEGILALRKQADEEGCIRL